MSLRWLLRHAFWQVWAKPYQQRRYGTWTRMPSQSWLLSHKALPIRARKRQDRSRHSKRPLGLVNGTYSSANVSKFSKPCWLPYKLLTSIQSSRMYQNGQLTPLLEASSSSPRPPNRSLKTLPASIADQDLGDQRREASLCRLETSRLLLSTISRTPRRFTRGWGL